MGRRVSVIVKAVAVEQVYTTEAYVDSYRGAGTITVEVGMRARPRGWRRCWAPVVVVARRTLIVMMFAAGTLIGIAAGLVIAGPIVAVWLASRTIVVISVGTVVIISVGFTSGTVMVIPVWTVVFISSGVSVLVMAFLCAVFVATMAVAMAAECRGG